MDVDVSILLYNTYYAVVVFIATAFIAAAMSILSNHIYFFYHCIILTQPTPRPPTPPFDKPTPTPPTPYGYMSINLGYYGSGSGKSGKSGSGGKC